jgi:hypothetical protein
VRLQLAAAHERAATSACGAACFILVCSHLSRVDAWESLRHQPKELLVAQCGSRLLDHGPGDIHKAGQEVEVLEVTQQAHRPASGLREANRMECSGSLSEVSPP